MTSREQLDTAGFDRVTTGDFARWAVSVVLIATVAGAGVVSAQRWSPAVATVVAPEPAMLIDLAPLPAPEPIPEPEPEAEAPPPEIEQSPVEQPVIEPPPPVAPEPLPEPPVVEPTPPMEEPPPPEVEPEVAPAQEEPVVQPESLPEEPTVSDIAMPVMMSPELRQRRADTPATPRPQRDPAPRKPVAEPQQKPATAQPPAQAAAPSISPDQWQSQVLRRLDQRKVYPRAARDRGESGAVVISFAVDAGGRVTSVGVARSSGFSTLDQAAIETARRASPLPRPPAGFAGQSLSATIRFTLR